MRRLAMVVVAGMLALAGCGGDDDDNESTDTTEAEDDAVDDEGTDTTEAEDDTDATEPEDDDTDTTEPESEGDDEGSEAARAFIEASGLDIPPDEADCVVEGLFEEISVEELAGLDDLGPGEMPSAQTVEAMANTLDACVSQEKLDAIISEQFAAAAPPGNEEAVACLVEAIGGQLTMGDFLRIGLISEADPESPDLEPYMTVIEEAAAGCV